VIKSCGQVIMFFDESKKGSQGSFGGKHVSLLYKICMLMPKILLLNIIIIFNKWTG
jgi:hypothetical protein